MTDPITLAQDLAARICHDLGGPVGMVAGMLDLAPDAEALATAREGAAELRRRLLLWRAAAGGAGPVPLSDLAPLTQGLLAGGRATLAVAAESAPRAEAGRLLLLAAMVAGEALPKGGAVEIAAAGEGFVVLADGPLLRWPPALLAGLAGEDVEAGPRSVLPRLLLSLASAQGWRVELLMEASGAAAVLFLAPPAG
ncbi:MAG: histidine phosphotransferase family protein [Acetobacteraceae bacterium]|nr:histidine phosphotransferase family protein [Acetobacteraceae bacterium]